MKNNLQLQCMESSNEVDFLIYEVLDPTPLLSTLEDGRAKKYQNKEEMKSHCQRIVKCVNTHDELVNCLQAFVYQIETYNLKHEFPGAYMDAKNILNKVNNTN